MSRFLDEFCDRKLTSISSDAILSFLNRLTRGQKQTTKRIRYANLKTFFNFAISTFDIKFNNPCDTPALKKLYREAKLLSWLILEKDIVDEIILHHANLSTTQRYLGKISDVEALRWIKNLHG